MKPVVQLLANGGVMDDCEQKRRSQHRFQRILSQLLRLAQEFNKWHSQSFSLTSQRQRIESLGVLRCERIKTHLKLPRTRQAY